MEHAWRFWEGSRENVWRAPGGQAELQPEQHSWTVVGTCLHRLKAAFVGGPKALVFEVPVRPGGSEEAPRTHLGAS